MLIGMLREPGGNSSFPTDTAKIPFFSSSTGLVSFVTSREVDHHQEPLVKTPKGTQVSISQGGKNSIRDSTQQSKKTQVPTIATVCDNEKHYASV